MLTMDLEILVLAAGLSRRMKGMNKLLLAVEGMPLIRRTVSLYRSFSQRVTVVLGHDEALIRQALDGLDVRLIVNESYLDGQQSSVRRGLNDMTGDGDAVVIALGDQPLLEASDLEAMFAEYAQSCRDKILIPYFDAERGNPIIIPASIARDIKAGSDNPGCRKFIDGNPHLASRFQVSNSHFTTDIDTPRAAARLGIDVGLPVVTEVIQGRTKP